ncbi:hypothetical protein VP1G_11139 [Cytospora mali]|uniref:Uncharacterized protein n=1 Tax=Cytospora mali TaxID=578113 RepID=A0A194V6L7_CYTMA|nr:hypothetical protein VP1G_11139 [Valsa mali var. pyri (nom. inval.)]
MPETRSKLGNILFTIQSIISFLVFLFASQQEKFAWAGWVTSGGLALWAAIGIPLLVIYRQVLLHPTAEGGDHDIALVTHMINRPESQPISHDQLITEVKGIYAGLVMIESKCIMVDNAQIAQNDSLKLGNEQWTGYSCTSPDPSPRTP